MKRLFIVITVLLSFLVILGSCAAALYSPGYASSVFDPNESISEQNIPDENFRSVLVDTMGLTTLGECSNVIILTVVSKDVYDITGISYFRSLIELHMAHNHISVIPTSIVHLQPTLELIDFSDNSLDIAYIEWLNNTFPTAEIFTQDNTSD